MGLFIWGAFMARNQGFITLWAVLSLTISACAHDMRVMKMEEALNSYGSAIRWGAFQKAWSFQADKLKPAPDFKALRTIKVTGYESVFRSVQDEGNTVLQTVEIRYIDNDRLVEKSLTDEQKWHFDVEKKQWLLDSPFPKFESRDQGAQSLKPYPIA
jgi:YD repeat-containing protein